MNFRVWPIIALSLLSCSPVGLSTATAAEPIFHVRDPAFLTGEALPSLLAELSVDPDVRISVATATLKALTPSFHSGVEPSVPTKVGSNELIALVAREGIGAGMDPSYLVRLADRESHFDPFAESSTSTAAGLFQFTDNTWLCSLREFGPGLGLVGSDQIWRDRRGVCKASAPDERARLLALRSDARLSTRVAAAFSLRNYRVLSAELGRRPTRTELYLLHFFGEETGLRFLQTYHANPNASALSLAKAGALANREIFFDGSAGSRSVKEVFIALRL